jgi:Predicted integral membrane protein
MAEKKPVESSSSISRNRLEFLFDGVFAISMTILVLELKVPELADRHSTAEMGQMLLHHGRSFLSYILSFFMLGVLWYSHNNYYKYFQQITKSILCFTLVQMATAAFFPFCAALAGRYPTNRLSMVIYLGCIMVYEWCCLIQWLLAKRQSILVPRLSPSIYAKLKKGHRNGSIYITSLFLIYLLSMLYG